jgi:hypothetical protein
VGAALVLLCLSHVEEHLDQEPEVRRIRGEEDWVLSVAVWFFLEELDGDGHQLVLFVQVEQGNGCHQLQNAKFIRSSHEADAKSKNLPWALLSYCKRHLSST